MPSSHPTVMAYFKLLEASENSASASSLLRSGQKNPLTENTPAEPRRAGGGGGGGAGPARQAPPRTGPVPAPPGAAPPKGLALGIPSTPHSPSVLANRDST